MDYQLTYLEKEVKVDWFLKNLVDVEKFLASCKQCPNYGNVWSCPPYDFDVMDFWHRYETLLISAVRIDYTGKRTMDDMMEVFWNTRKNLSEKMFWMEADVPDSLSLCAGSCHICSSCARPEGAPCRFPNKMRYSIESLGGDVAGTLDQLFDIKMLWAKDGQLPDYFVLVGGLLKK